MQMHRLFYLFKIILQATNKRNVEPNMMYAILLITLEYILKSFSFLENVFLIITLL
jgi:hypothetical protein